MSEQTQRIENPSEPRHYALLRLVDRSVEISRAGRALARSRRAYRLLEHGRSLYDPVLYLPAEDVSAALRERTETTHCPLKGDARYFDLMGAEGEIEAEKIAWSYPEPIQGAEILADLIAFYPQLVTVREGDA